MEKKRSETEELCFVSKNKIITVSHDEFGEVFTIWLQMLSLVKRGYWHYHPFHYVHMVKREDFKRDLYKGVYGQDDWTEIKGWASVKAKIFQESFDGDY